MIRSILVALLLLCTSCIQFGNELQPRHYYLLESMTEAPNAYPDYTLTINLELAGFPDYLAHKKIVTRNGPNDIKFAASDRWAEPVQESLMRIVRENLTLLLPGSHISVSPWESSNSHAIKVKLLVNNFLGKLDDHTRIDIRWLIDNQSGQTMQGHFTDRQPIGSSYQDLVVGLNKGINNLSLELAKKLAGE
ncbi:MAG: PqiC family protein [Desulfuromusa sp.]|nr:PqiC family protein [Desulfuromusa sp.]